MFKILILSILLMMVFTEDQYTRVVLKTCRGWALKKYPEVKDFIEKDAAKYKAEELVIDYEAGGKPRFVVQKDDEDLRVLDISKLTRI